jgi:hypothetical protein
LHVFAGSIFFSFLLAMYFVGFADATAGGKPAPPALWWVVHAGSGVQIVRVPADASSADVQVAVQEKTGDKTHVRIKERCAADREIRVSRVDDRERLIALAAGCSGGNANWRQIVASWQLCNPVSSWRGAEFEGNTVVELEVSQCGLTGKLDASNFVALTYCGNGRLQALDVSGCVALTRLQCYNNRLQTLDVLGCVALTHFHCYNNQLQALNVSSCVALTRLHCGRNQLQALDVSSCVALSPGARRVELRRTHSSQLLLQPAPGARRVELRRTRSSFLLQQPAPGARRVELRRTHPSHLLQQPAPGARCVKLHRTHESLLQQQPAPGAQRVDLRRTHSSQLLQQPTPGPQRVELRRTQSTELQKPAHNIQIDWLVPVVITKSCRRLAIGCDADVFTY